MSDTIPISEIIASHPLGIDVLGQYQKWAELQQAQNQGALGQQQVIGEQQKNALGALNLARTGWLYNAMGVPGVGGAGVGASPLAGVGAGAAPGGMVPQGGAAPQGGSPLAGAGAPGGVGSQGSPLPAPSDFAMQTLHFPAPQFQAAQAMSSQNPTAAAAELYKLRASTLTGLLGSAGPNLGAAVDQAVAAGWMDPRSADMLKQNPAQLPAFLQHLAGPEANLSADMALGQNGLARGANGNVVSDPTAAAAVANTAAMKTAAEGRFIPTTVTQPTGAKDAAGNPIYGPTNTNRTAAAMAGNVQQPASALVNPNAPMSYGDYAAKIAQHESGGNAGAVNPQPGQTASGTSGFIDNTWNSFIQAQHPELAQGKTPAQIAALKTDPSVGAALGTEATQWYAKQNAPVLQAAGLPVNGATLALAHQFGPDGVTKVLTAPQNAPIASVVGPGVMQANPDLRGKTVGQVVGQTVATFGVSPVVEASAAPAIPGVPAGIANTPQQEAGLGVAKANIDADRAGVQAALDKAQGAQTQQTQMLQSRALIPQINAGSLADARQTVQNFLATFSPEAAQKFEAGITAGIIDPTKAGATQEFIKQTLNGVASIEKDTFGHNAGLGTTELYQKAYPNIGMQPSAMKDMFNLLAVAQQRIADYGQQKAQYFNQQQQVAMADPSKYQPAQKFDAQFVKENPPQVYAAAAAALNGHPYAEWAKGITPQQQTKALQIMWRTDPSATAWWMGPDGKPVEYHNPALKGQ